MIRFLIMMALFVASCADDEQFTPDLTVAFFGDQGLPPRSKAVLRMVKAEGAHMVLHLGDFDYADDAKAFDDQLNHVLGDNFPYFAVIGNHDAKAWPAYQRKLRARLKRIPGVKCEAGPRGTTPGVGLKPTMEQKLAGILRLPPKSEP